MKVLVFAPHAAIWIHAFPEALIAESLRQAGHEVVYVTCGGLLSGYCIPMSASGVRYDAPAQNKLAVCRTCGRNAAVIRKEFGFRGPSLAEETLPSDEAAVRQLLEDATRDNFKTIELAGLPVGRFALYQFLILRKKIGLEFTAEEWREYLTHLRSTALAAAVLTRIFAREKPDRVVLYNGLYSINMACRALAAKAGASSFFLHAGGTLARRLQTLILGREHTFRFYPALMSHWSRYSAIPISGAQMRPATDHFIEVLGGRSAFAYSTTKSGMAFDVRKRFGIAPGQKILVATMGSYDEEFAAEAVGARVHERPALFATQADWIRALLGHVAIRPDLFLIVRVHPREMPNRREQVKSEHAGLLERVLVDLPGNAVVNWPTDGISLYDLAEESDVFLNSWSSVGKEMTMLGRPVITYGCDIIFYPPELNYTGHTVEEFLAQIDRALDDGWCATRIRDAYRWLAIEYGTGLIDIGESYAERENASRKIATRVLRRARRIFDPQALQRQDCRNRAPALRASGLVNRIVVENAETVLDVLDPPSAGVATIEAEWAALREEVGRLIRALYPQGGQPAAGTLHGLLAAFAHGEDDR